MSLKAFNLVPTMDRLPLSSEKAQTKVQCVEACGQNLYVGTNDGYVLHFLVDNDSGSRSLKCIKQGHRFIGQKKEITKLKAASAVNRLIVLSDGNISLLSMMDLEFVVSNIKIKNVVTFCLNLNPVDGDPFSVEVCIASRKKQVHLFSISEQKISLLKEIAVNGTILNMLVAGVYICLALSSRYMIINSAKQHTQDLFPYDSTETVPLIIWTGKDEFLLNAPGGIGMFANASGMSAHPPVQWSESLISVVYFHPYVLALGNKFISVHSIIDQQQKQSIPYHGGVWLGEYDGLVYVASQTRIHSIEPVPFEEQVQELLNDRRVTEALDLARNARKMSLSKESFALMYKRIQQQAAFIKLHEADFDEAKLLFLQGDVDMREIIVLYPNLLPTWSTFIRSAPPLHDIPDIAQFTLNQPVRVELYGKFLYHFLLENRTCHIVKDYLKEVDCVLVKLCAKFLPADCPHLINNLSPLDPSDLAQWLTTLNSHHSLALLYYRNQDEAKALQIWQKLFLKELHDEHFPGLTFVLDVMSKLKSCLLLLQHLEWLLPLNSTAAVEILIKRSDVDTQQVLDFLSRNSTAQQIYLQHIVLSEVTEKSEHHNQLAHIYLKSLSELLEQQKLSLHQSEVSQVREQLQFLLRTSNFLTLSSFLSPLADHSLHVECVIVHQRLQQHENALNILVFTLYDFSAAETYCCQSSDRKLLLHKLLKMYLDPQYKDQYLQPAINLLQRQRTDFDYMEVLQLLPEHLSLQGSLQFMSSMLNHVLSKRRQQQLCRQLACCRNKDALQLSRATAQMGVGLEDDSYCAVCLETFSEPCFVRYPNGLLVHLSCANDFAVCPVSQQIFGIVGSH